MKLESYFLTVAVQAGIVSLCCLLVTLCIRQARWRAGFALTALLATRFVVMGCVAIGARNAHDRGGDSECCGIPGSPTGVGWAAQ